MARVPKLVPYYDKTRQKWVVNISAKMSPTGVRQRVMFDRGKEQEALDYAKQLRESRELLAGKATGARPELLAAAVKWEEWAIEFGFRGLDHFCEVKFSELEKSIASPLFSELLDAFEADHSKNWSKDYLTKRWRPFRRRLHEVEQERISVMVEDYWRKWMSEWADDIKPGTETYNQQLGMIRTMFELNVAKRFHPINPLDAIPGMKDRVKRSVPVSSPEDTLKLLRAAWEHDREMVPYFAVCYFAGLRPDSEAKSVKFEHFNWSEGYLKVNVTKTNEAAHRYVPIEDALRAWLEPWMRRTGSIIPSNFTKRRRRLIYGAHTTEGAALTDESTWKQLVPWGHDISRHSYGSYWEAEHRGQPGCREHIVANMGHENFKTFNRYYKNSRLPSEAAAFWGIRPPAPEGNVVKIA